MSDWPIKTPGLPDGYEPPSASLTPPPRKNAFCQTCGDVVCPDCYQSRHSFKILNIEYQAALEKITELCAELRREGEALAILRELVAGADDHRCWWIPNEISGRVRALVEGETP